MTDAPFTIPSDIRGADVLKDLKPGSEAVIEMRVRVQVGKDNVGHIGIPLEVVGMESERQIQSKVPEAPKKTTRKKFKTPSDFLSNRIP